MAVPFAEIFFDLDGTILDSQPGIIAGVRHALAHFGIEADPESLFCFIGPPLRPTFRERFGFSAEEAEVATAKYREYYSVTGLFESAPYAGVGDLLSDLARAGKHISLATSKPESFARTVLRHFGLDGHFAVIAGATMDGSRDSKELVLRYACAQRGLSGRENCLMVGDKRHDVEGAHGVGMPCAGVLYGYGDEEELRRAGADHIFASVADLRTWLLDG